MNKYTFEELYIGLKEEFEVVITEEKMRQFENMSGDINPLHINKEYANSKNMPDRVVYGMLTSSFYRGIFTWRKVSITRNRYKL